jgi:hypothetical protein
MPTPPREAHPYLKMFLAALVPHVASGPDHSKDPPPPHIVPIAAGSPEGRQVLHLLLGADADIRHDHARAAGINLDLAETELKLALSHGGPQEALSLALSRIADARTEAAKGHSARACTAIAEAIGAVVPKA